MWFGADDPAPDLSQAGHQQPAGPAALVRCWLWVWSVSVDQQLTTEATETLSKVNGLLDWIGTKANDATNFTLEQAPEVAQEILACATVSAWIGIVVFGLLLLIAIATFIVSVWAEIEGLAFFAFVAFFGFGAGLMFNIYDLVKVSVAPRLYLVEWCRDAIGGAL